MPLDGGPEQPLATDWGTFASYSPDGKQFVYNRHPAPWTRKHYRGSYSADLWLCDLDSKSSRKLLDADLPDDMKPNNLWPMFGKDGFTSSPTARRQAKAGSPEVMKSVNNIWKLSMHNGGPPVQVTHHTSGSLFWPSMSADGRTIVYEENFGLWKLDLNNGRHRRSRSRSTSSPTAARTIWKRRRLVARPTPITCRRPASGRSSAVEGELFTVATDRGDPRRVTRTPGVRETSPQWSPDGKWIAFISDESGREEVWLCDEKGGQLKKVSDSDTEKSAPVWSPDSKALLFPAGDKKLYKYTLDGAKTDVLVSGDVVDFGSMAVSRPQWSPDSKWVSFTRADATLLPHVYVIPADGGQAKRITGPDSYSDTNALWTPDGKKIVYLSGMDVGNIGEADRNNTAQLYAVSLVPEEQAADGEGCGHGSGGGDHGPNDPSGHPAISAGGAKLERRRRHAGAARRCYSGPDVGKGRGED